MELVIIGGIVATIIVGIFLFLQRKKIIAAKGKEYMLKGDPQGQKEYEDANAPALVLNNDEKEELSWQFLYELTDHILENFSQADQDKLKEIGKKMQENGIEYEHVVKLGIRHEYVKKLEANAKQAKESGHIR